MRGTAVQTGLTVVSHQLLEVAGTAGAGWAVSGPGAARIPLPWHPLDHIMVKGIEKQGKS